MQLAKCERISWNITHHAARPSILRNLYQMLTNKILTPENAAQKQIDDRVTNFLIKSDDTDLILDCRVNNDRIKACKFDPFWEEMSKSKYLGERSVVDERRQTDSTYMPFAISVKDLRQQILQRLPAGTAAPSTSWMRLNFQPKNPNVRLALNYTGKFPVKYAVQQRLLTAQHVDDQYAMQLYQYMKTMACDYKEYSTVVSLDDKAIVPVGDPGLHTSTGVRAHHRGLTVMGQRGWLRLYHDYHVAGLVPSVCFVIDIPSHPRDSWYNGHVHVTVKDKVLQVFSPKRHAIETVKILHRCVSNDDVNLSSPILFVYSDGGPDPQNIIQIRAAFPGVSLHCS